MIVTFEFILRNYTIFKGKQDNTWKKVSI